MLIKFDWAALSETKAHEYLTRFLLGGATCIATGLIAKAFGPVIGGLFLAFPAIFPASATLVDQHERQRKARAGIRFTVRGRLSAALDARGASIGALALIGFAVIVWKLINQRGAVTTLAIAMAAWLCLAGGLWRLRRLHTRFFVLRQRRKG
jgi:Protein of unknown function (DUF3147)